MKLSWDPYINHGDQAPTEVNLETSQILVDCFRVYKERFGSPKNILYPASGSDISLFSAFPEAKTTLVDPNKFYMGKIRKEIPSADAHCMNFEDFQKKDFDFAFIANAWWDKTHENLPDHIKIWWHLLAEWAGWNFDAERYLKSRDPRLKLVGVIIGEQGLEYSTTDIEEYYKQTRKDEHGRTQFKKQARYYIFEVVGHSPEKQKKPVKTWGVLKKIRDWFWRIFS